MSETTQYTPEELLELARAAMPKCHWIVNPKGGVEETSTMHGYELLFDPLNNPAHAWAVEQWLFGVDRCVVISHVQKHLNGLSLQAALGDCEVEYRIWWRGQLDCDGHDCFDTNLSAALAVLRRMKEKIHD